MTSKKKIVLVNEINNIIKDYLRDSRLKNIGAVNFIETHTIVISVFVIMIGIIIIYSSYTFTGQIKTNTIKIDTQYATEKTFIYGQNKTYVYLNKTQDLPFSISIIADFCYKQPLMYGDNLNFNDISILLKNENDSINISKIDLILYESNSAFYHANGKEFNVAQFSKTNLSDFQLCYSFGDSLKLLKLNSNNEFEIYYLLKINDEKNRIFEIKGKTDLESPIRCANDIESTNIRINKSILFLTGWLIILGSVPFSISLKELLGKK